MSGLSRHSFDPWRWTSLVGPCHGIPCHAFSTLSKAEDHSVLKQLKDEEDELKQYVDTLVWPKLTCFQAFGKTYKLPLRSRIASKSPTAAELAYLGGFFDGDGCVTREYSLSGCMLQVAQLAINAEVLILFRQFLGGSICAKDQGMGMRQPTLQWTVHGGKARAAARQLSNVCLSKAEQLQLAINWPDDKDARQLVADKLQQLKRSPPKFRSKSSWAHLAGFFDSDGCIHIRSYGAYLSLDIFQKYAPLLLQSKVFLDLKLGASHVHVQQCRGGYELAVYDQKTVYIILQKLFNAGLIVKRATTELALSLPENSHLAIREKMSVATTGNQGRYARLDAEGCKRAKHIKGLQTSKYNAQRKNDADLVAQLQSQLASLKLKHEIENAKCRICRRRLDIQQLLASYASTQPNLTDALDLKLLGSEHDLKLFGSEHDLKFSQKMTSLTLPWHFAQATLREKHVCLAMG